MTPADGDASNLTPLANEADGDGVQRARDAVAGSRRRPAAWAAVAVAAMVAGTAVGVGYVGSPEPADNQATEEQPRAFVPLPVEEGEPCAMAERVPLDVLQMAAGVPVLMPESSVASRETLSGTWLCGNIPLLEFGDLRLSFESGWGNVDPAEKFADLMRDYGGEVLDILGHPAWIDPATDESQQLALLLVNAGTLIRFSSDYGSPVTEDDLVDAASTLDLAPN